MTVLPGRIQLLLLLIGGAVLTGCATSGRNAESGAVAQSRSAASASSDEADVFDEFSDFEEFEETDAVAAADPLSGYNRGMFTINDKLFFWVLKPISNTYNFIVPQGFRICVSSFFKNLRFPQRFINQILQLKFSQSGIEVLRFCLNSTIGMGGLMDPAYDIFKLESLDEDFGQTLGHYGVGGGWPVVIPFLGQSNVRDLLCIVPDFFTAPMNYVQPASRVIAVNAIEKINFVSLHYRHYEELKRSAVDPYVFFRDAYTQNRNKNIEE